MDFENSQTKKNLEAAFAGESQAHTKYRYYASRAKKDASFRSPTSSWRPL